MQEYLQWCTMRRGDRQEAGEVGGDGRSGEAGEKENGGKMLTSGINRIKNVAEPSSLF